MQHKHSIIFFTLPPDHVAWHYVLININRPEVGLRYIARHKKHIKRVLIDSGVELFKDPQVREYPEGANGRVRKAIRYYVEVRSLVPWADILVTIPDYPDDYVDSWGRPHNLWVNGQTNIDRTIENIVYAVENYTDIPWLIPIQGYYMQPRSIVFSIQRLEELGILQKYDYFAAANLCTTRSVNVILRTLRIARSRLPQNAKIHSFGLSMVAIAKAYHMLDSTDTTANNLDSPDHHWAEYLVPRAIALLDSTDSTAWTKPTKLAYEKYLKLLNRKRASRKGKIDSEVYFWAWLYTLTHKYNVAIEGVDKHIIRRNFEEALRKALGEKT